MNSLSGIQRWGVQQLTHANIDSAALDARLLLQHVLGITREEMLLNEPAITDEQKARYEQLIVRRSNHEPVAKIIGKKPFWKYEFITTKDTLDPRPDSETLIEATLKHRPPASSNITTILDLGTGTGCLLLSLLGEYDQARGLGVDKSEEALAVAQQNAEALAMLERTQFHHGDWLQGLSGDYDIIITNPPYIPMGDKEHLASDVVDYDPHLALFASNDGLAAYETILENVRTLLAKGGLLVVEAGAGQAEAVKRLGKRGDLHPVETVKDSGAIPRAVIFESID